MRSAPALPRRNAHTRPDNRGALFARHVNPHLVDRLRQCRQGRHYADASGIMLRDADGIEIADFTSQYGALPFGHNDPGMWAAVDAFRASGQPVFAQASLLGPAGELARDLLDCAPAGLERVTFVNTGAEAVEAAIKIARARTGRMGVASALGSFHGKTLGALAATGRRLYQEPFCRDDADFAKVAFGDLDALRALLDRRGSDLALFLVEPIQGEGGMRPAPAGYLAAAAALCRDAGVLLAIDEVQTGLGRTGAMFATPDEVRPDLLMIAKALGGGLVPIGACLSTADAMTPAFALKHSSTFAGGGLACSIGAAVLARLAADDGRLLANVRERGAQLMRGLARIREACPTWIADVRGRGLMIGVEFVPDGSTGENPVVEVAADMLERHRIRLAGTLNQGNVLRIQPPLVVGEEACARFLAAFADTAARFAAAVNAPLERADEPA